MSEYQFAGERWKGTIPSLKHIEQYNEVIKKYSQQQRSQVAAGFWGDAIPPGESPQRRKCVNFDCEQKTQQQCSQGVLEDEIPHQIKEAAGADHQVAGGFWGGAAPPAFYIESGYYFCEKCDSCNGKALGFFDYKEYDRFSYRRKSIYQRKYHYENTVKDIGKRLSLSDDEEYLLLSKLKDIDEDIIREINFHFKRKRIISIYYIIKQILKEMGCQKYHQLGLKLSKETFQKYEEWWEMYQSKKEGLGDEILQKKVTT